MDRTIGVIGLGIMGSAISANLIKTGFSVIGFDIDPERVRSLTEGKGRGAASCREVGEAAEIVITSLPSVAALQDVVKGKDGLREVLQKGRIVVETSTLPLDAKREALDALNQAGLHLLDCPLSGTGAQAIRKDLAIYASGDRDAFELCRPVFHGFGRAVYFLGDFGNGSKMKFVANLLVAIHNVASAEAFVLGMKAGLDPETIYKVISDGAGTSRMFEIRGPLMVAGRYDEATMKVGVFQKDLDIIASFAESLQSPTPLLSKSAEIYAKALEDGRAGQDTAAVCAVLEDMAGMRRQRKS